MAIDHYDHVYKFLLITMGRKGINLIFCRNGKFLVKRDVTSSEYEQCKNNETKYSVLFTSEHTFDINKKEWDTFCKNFRQYNIDAENEQTEIIFADCINRDIDAENEQRQIICADCINRDKIPKWVQSRHALNATQANYIIVSIEDLWNKLQGVKRLDILEKEKYCKLQIEVYNDPESETEYLQKKPAIMLMQFLQRTIGDKKEFVIFFRVMIFSAFATAKQLPENSNFLTSGFFKLENYKIGERPNRTSLATENINFNLQMSAEPQYKLIFDRDCNQYLLPRDSKEKQKTFSDIIKHFQQLQKTTKADFPQMPNLLCAR